MPFIPVPNNSANIINSRDLTLSVSHLRKSFKRQGGIISNMYNLSFRKVGLYLLKPQINKVQPYGFLTNKGTY